MKNSIKQTALFSFMILLLLLFANACSKEDSDPVSIQVPTLETANVSDITYNTANSGGKVLSNGGAGITQRGVCFSTGSTPTVEDEKTIDGTGDGTFSSTLEGLQANTTYNFRAFATNSKGTGYGEIKSFTTQKQTAISQGVILKTTNGGVTWEPQIIDNIHKLFAVYFLDDTTGFAVGDAGIILKTSNSGATWSIKSSGGYILMDIHFSDANNGYAVGNSGVILRTTDAGNTWVKEVFQTNLTFRSIYFTGLNNGYIGGSIGAILKTTDAGDTWKLNYTSSSGVYDIKFIDDNTGYAVGGKGIAKSIDGGDNWNFQLTGPFIVSAIQPINSDLIFAVGSQGYVYKTTNAGTNWIEMTANLSYNLTTLFFLDTEVGYVAGFDGDIFKTVDGGKNWVAQSSGTNKLIESIFFINSNIGFAVGHMTE